MSILRSRSRVTTALAAVFLALTPASVMAQEGDFARFSEYSETSRTKVDYEAWTLILSNIVFDVGHSDRTLPGPRAQVTGTRIALESRSRYRNEGNRIAYHLLEDIHKEAISDYRAELEALPQQISLSELNSNEQLAFWLNLHNAILIDEITQDYPVRRIDRERRDGVPLLDAPLVTIEGVELSLNDIRFNIVEAGWQDPRIIYGFHLGAVGGATLRDEAFTGDRVWSQLESNGREFVNALRGVDGLTRNVEISPLYRDHAALFPNGAEDVKAHLTQLARPEVADLVDEIGTELRYLDFDWHIADLTNGRRGCSGPQNTANISVVSSGGTTSQAIDCQVLPPQALNLFEVVIRRRLEFLRNGDLGRVTIRDIPTPSNQSADDGEVVINLPERESESD